MKTIVNNEVVKFIYILKLLNYTDTEELILNAKN